jgi:hypothetical protein
MANLKNKSMNNQQAILKEDFFEIINGKVQKKYRKKEKVVFEKITSMWNSNYDLKVTFEDGYVRLLYFKRII